MNRYQIFIKPQWQHSSDKGNAIVTGPIIDKVHPWGKKFRVYLKQEKGHPDQF